MRKVNSVKNFLSDVIPYFLLAVFGFVQIRVFLANLGEEIYALNQLFIQLFSYISLVEGGVGAILSQKYYKLFIDDNREEINRTYTASKIAMRKISITILIIGFVLSFFLQFLSNNNLPLFYMQSLFMIYILRSVIEYLNLSPRFVLRADQKVYKLNLTINIFKIFEIIFEIVLLYFKVDYLIILLVSIVIRLIMYKIANKKVYNEYPWLHTVKENVPKVKGIGYMYFHKISGAIYNNTDILLISAKLSSLQVTIYSSYNYIIRYITDVTYMLGSSISASLGNVMYKESNENSYKIYNELNIFFLFCAAFLSINVYLLGDAFIGGVWLGNNYIITKSCLILMCYILFSNISKQIFTLYVETVAKFKETKVIVACEAGLNLILSIILIIKFGIFGTLLATIISYLVTTFWYYPYYIFKKNFKQNCMEYFKSYFVILFIVVLISYLGSKIISIITIDNLILWLIVAIISSISTVIILLVLFYLLFPSFRRILKKIISMLKRK